MEYKIKIKNREIEALFNSLQLFKPESMRLKRHLNKLLSRIVEKNDEMSKSLRSIQEVYLEFDENHNLKQDDKGWVITKEEYTMDEYEKEFDELMDEEIYIIFGEYKTQFIELFNAILDYSSPDLIDANIYVLDKVLDQFEEQRMGEKKNV